MKYRVTLSVLVLVMLLEAASAVAGPIIKPRKYHGPIPRSSFSLRVGFLGGASNQEMLDYFDTKVPDPARDETASNDFGNAPLIEATYIYKVHPQIALRANFYAAFLKSDWKGVLVPSIEPPDTATNAWQGPSVDAALNFDVDLFVLETSALYYFTDAAVKEFQPYFGGGFSFGLPHQKYKEAGTVRDPDSDPGRDPTDPPYEPIFETGQPLRTIEKDKWNFEAGVHGILGALYYFGNKWAASVEGRIQLMQSKSPPIEVLNEDGQPEDVDFIVDYSGFILAAGISYAF
jgi:hypothetical protein